MTPKRIYQGVKRRIANFIATNSSYHYLVRDWSQITDIDLAVKVLGTEFFRSQLKPVELPLYDGQRIMVIAPHQDDEIIGAGGTLLKASKLGAKINIVFATDGSQNNIGCSIEESVRTRHKEAQQVCNLLGAEFNVLQLSNYIPKLTMKHVQQLNEYVTKFNPDVLLIPWLLDAPIKHRMVNHLFALSNKINPFKKMEIWGYQVHNTLYPNGFTDITNNINEKNQLISYYKSQNDNIQCYDHLSLAMSMWNSRFMPITKTNGAIDKKYGEVFFTLPSSEYFNLIDNYYDKDIEQVYKGDKNIIHQVRNLMSEIKNDIS